MEDKDIERVTQILQRLDPIVNRFISNMLDKDGDTVAISVVSNLATTFMAHAIIMIEARGGDVDQFVKVLMHETKNKYEVARSQVNTELVLHKMMTAGRDTCRPLH